MSSTPTKLIEEATAKSHLERGKSFFKEGKFDEAISDLQKAIELDHKLSIARYHLGCAYQKKSNFVKALDCFQKAIDLEPKNPNFHYNLGNLWLLQKHFHQAIASYNKAIELDPQLKWSYCNLGQALESLGKLEEAVAVLKKAIQLDSNFMQAHHRLGRVFLKLGKINEAIVAYKTAIDIDTNFSQAYLGIAEALVKKAVIQQEKEGLNPNFYNAYKILGEALLTIGNTARAEVSSNKQELNSSWLQIYQSLGEALINLGQKKPKLKSNSGSIALRSASNIDENKQKKFFFDKTISLGSFCMAARQIRRNLQQQEAYIFDWWVTPHESLLQLIEKDFADLFKPDNLQVKQAARGNLELVFDCYYKHFYNHDFPRLDKDNPEMIRYGGGSVVDNWKSYLPQASQKYDFLANRWRNTLSKNRRILLVRVEYKWNPQKAIELRDLFLKCYPQIVPHFLLVGEAESPYDLREDWKLEKITTFHLPPPHPLNPPVPLQMGEMPPMDSGTEAWEKVLHRLNSVNSEQELPSHIVF